MNDTTQIQTLVRGIAPLANWFKQNRALPYVHRLHVKREHWQLLRERRDLAALHGFLFDGERILYQGFELLPTDCGARHTRNREPCK